MTAAATEPWYSGREETILFFRINRRPLAEPSMFASRPDSVLDHVAEALLFGEPVVTGRRHQRVWRLGERRIDTDQQTLTGQVGWQAVDAHARTEFDEENTRWFEAAEESGRGAFTAFALDATTRVLGVLRHRSMTEQQIPAIFRILLNRGEEQREGGATTDWDVEPILDPSTFSAWVRSVDSVQRLQLVAHLPNPDGLSEFGPVWNRMELHKARLIKEIMEAANPNVGLENLDDDEVVRAYLAMSEDAFGYITAKGTRDGRPRTFDQRTQMARQQTEPLPATWTELLGVVVGFVRRRRRDGNAT